MSEWDDKLLVEQPPTAPTEPTAAPRPVDWIGARVNEIADAEADLPRKQAQYLQWSAQNPSLPPQRHAEVLQLSSALGYSMDHVRDNYDDVKREAEAMKVDWRDIVKTAPITAMWMSDPSNHALIRDEVTKAPTLEWWVGKDTAAEARRTLQPVSQASQIPAFLKRALDAAVDLDTPALLSALAEPFDLIALRDAKPGALKKAWDNGVNNLAMANAAYDATHRGQNPLDDPNVQAYRSRMSGQLGEEDRGFLARSAVGFLGSAAFSVEAIAEGGALAMLGQAAAAYGGVTPVGLAGKTLGAFGAFNASRRFETGMAMLQYAEDAKARGLKFDPQKAAVWAHMAGIVNGLQELASAAVVYKWASKIPFVKNAVTGLVEDEGAKLLGAEGVLRKASVSRALMQSFVALSTSTTVESLTEAGQSLVTDIGGAATRVAEGEEFDLSDARQKAFDEFKGGMISFWPMGLVSVAGAIHEEIGRKQLAERGFTRLMQTHKIMADMQLQERSVDSAVDLGERLASADSAPAYIYVKKSAFDAGMAKRHLSGEEAARFLTGSDAAYQAAIKEGNDSDIAIPFAQWIARIAPYAEGQAELLRGARTTREGVYIGDFENAQKELAALMEVKPSDYSEGANKLYDMYRSQIPTDMGEITEEQADYASRLFVSNITRLAAKAGYDDAHQFWVDGNYRLNIRQQTQESKADALLRQHQLELRRYTYNPAFKEWFRDSKVVDEKGDPMVVYHGTPQRFDSTFKTEDGAHFSTDPNVSGLFGSGYRFDLGYDEDASRIYPAMLSIKRPLRLQDRGMWGPLWNYHELVAAGFTDQEIRSGGSLRELLATKGYDGVVYLNRAEITDANGQAIFAHEDERDHYTDALFKASYPEAADAYIAFEPEQIKSPFNVGTFAKDQPSIYLQKARTHEETEAERNAAAQAWKPDSTTEGVLKGAPEWVNNHTSQGARAMAHNRNLATQRQLFADGLSQMRWYQDSMLAVLDMVGHNFADAERFAQLLAIYSPNQNVWSNAMFALRAWHQWKGGVPEDKLHVGIGDLDKKAAALLYHGKRWSGAKTNNFYVNMTSFLYGIATPEQRATMQLDQEALDAIGNPVTVDVWMYRAHGYQNEQASGDKGGGKFSYVENVTKKIAAEAGVMPMEAQAAIWTAINARWNLASVRDAETDNERLKRALAANDSEVQAAIHSEAMSFARALEGMTQTFAVEAIPAAQLGHLIVNAPYAEKQAFTAAARDLVADIPKWFGIDFASVEQSDGYWGGEPNPNIVVRVTTGKEAGAFDPALADQLASSFAYVFSQNEVPWWRPDVLKGDIKKAAKSKTHKRAIDLRLSSSMPVDERERLGVRLQQEAGAGFTVMGDKRLAIINLTDLPNDAFESKVMAVAKEFDRVESTLGYFVAAGTARNDWVKHPDGREHLDAIEARAGAGGGWARPPDLLARLDRRRAEYQALLARHESHAYASEQRLGPHALAGAVEDVGPRAAFAAGPPSEREQAQALSALASLPSVAARHEENFGKFYREQGRAISEVIGSSAMQKVGVSYSEMSEAEKAETMSLVAGALSKMRASDKGHAVAKAPHFAANAKHEQAAEVYGVHYSSIDGLKQLDPTFAGTGSAGAERKRFGRGRYGASGQPGAARTYFYAFENEDLPQPEHAVDGNHVYATKLTNLYDLRKDALGIAASLETSNVDLLEEKVAAAGFDGVIHAPGAGANAPVAVLFNVKGKQIPVAQLVRAQSRLYQDEALGFIEFMPGERTFDITLLGKANVSTLIHETAHFLINVMADVASRDGASAEAVQDYQTILSWMGYSDHKDREKSIRRANVLRGLEAPTDKQRSELAALDEKEERFARGWETYLWEGRPPTAELARPFTLFRAWLSKVGRTAKALATPLTPEVRDVFDRLSASEEAIEDARHVVPHEASGEALAAMTDSEKAAHAKASQEAATEPENVLRALVMDDQRQTLAQWFLDERARISETVRQALLSTPVYRALWWLQRGEMPNGAVAPAELLAADGSPLKLDAAALRAYLTPIQMKRLQRQRVYQAEGGISDELASVALGFKSGATMVDALLRAEPLEQLVTQETESQLQQLYPDLLKDAEKLAEAANLAVLGEARAQQLMIEIRALARVAKLDTDASYQPADVKTLREAAQLLIESRRYAQISPNQYLNAMQREVRRAANAKTAAIRYDALQAQLWNMQLYRASLQARTEIDKVVAYAGSFDKLSKRQKLGLAGPTYVDAANEILIGLNFKKESETEARRRIDLRTWVEERLSEPGQFADVIIAEWMQDPKRLGHSWRELTLSELRQVRDGLKNIETLAGHKNTYLTNKGKRETENVVLPELVGALQTNMPHLGAVTYSTTTPQFLQRKLRSLEGAAANLLKIQELVRRLDGGQVNGPWARYIWNPIAEAEARERDLTLEITQKLMEAIERMPSELRGKLHDVVLVPLMGQTFTRLDILVMALNTGNASNLQKMLLGVPTGVKQWDATSINSAIQNLTTDEMDFVQSVWDILGSLWPEVAALETKLTGVPPTKIAPQSFTFRGKEYAGGYYPIKYDPRMSAAGRHVPVDSYGLMDNNYTRAITPQGHLQERIANFAAPIKLDISVIPSHIVSVIHDLTHREALISIDRLLHNQGLRNTMQEYMGDHLIQQLDDWVRNTANGQNHDVNGAVGMAEQISRWSRRNMSVMALGFKATMFWQNFTNFFSVLDQVKSQYLAEGMRISYTDWSATVELVNSKSNEMKHRFNNIDRDTRELILSMMVNPKYRHLAKIRRAAGYFTAVSDRAVAYPAWVGAYRQAQAEGESEANAVAFADRSVALTLGGIGRKDMANIQNSNEAMKWFTTFYSWMSVQYNTLSRIRFDAATSRRNGGGVTDFSQILARTLFVFVGQALLAELIVGRGPDDDEPYAKWVARKALLYPFLLVPGVRDLASAVEGGLTGHPRDVQFGAVASIGTTFANALIDDIKLLGEDDELDEMTVKRNIRAIGYASGLPLQQGLITGEYLWDLKTGEEDPDDFWEAGRNLQFSRRQ